MGLSIFFRYSLVFMFFSSVHSANSNLLLTFLSARFCLTFQIDLCESLIYSAHFSQLATWIFILFKCFLLVMIIFRQLSITFFFFAVFFLYGHAHSMWKFLVQRWNPYHSSNQRLSSDDTRSLIHWPTRELWNFHFLNKALWNFTQEPVYTFDILEIIGVKYITY